MLRERIIDSNISEKRVFSHKSSGVTNSGSEKTKNSKQLQQKQITIKFVGDLNSNIQDIVSKLSCPEACKVELQQILHLYANKIIKLREQRNFYKANLLIESQNSTSQINRLQKRIQQLEYSLQQKNQYQNSICEKCTCFGDPDFMTQNYSQVQKASEHSNSYPDILTTRFKQEYLPKSSRSQFLIEPAMQSSKISQQDQLLLSHQNQETHSLLDARPQEKMLQTPKDKALTEEQLNQLMMRYNFSLEELQNILEEYQTEHKLAEELFDSEGQKQLYKLGQKMQKDLWNNKMISDIKKLSSIKSKSLFQDISLDKK